MNETAIKILEAKIAMYQTSSIPTRIVDQIIIKLQNEIRELSKTHKKGNKWK